MMNKRGTLFFGLTIAIVVWVFGILFLPFIVDDVTSFRDAVTCSDTSNTGGTLLSCLAADALVPYFILFVATLALGFIGGVIK